MKNLIISIVIAIFTTSTHAENWRDPESNFDATRNFTDASLIKWVVTKDVQGTCEAESRKRNMGGFGYPVEACSFWDAGGKSCIIITNTNTTMHAIGHEMRHCFQGNYH
ncbi:hypothetical protein UFOVP257_287 [uncultured Caudovirales phage]|uniref:Uncharacterized protein n=1 Tax=uncultured Caudovirales phage TaxID=2100421 RepID=A0A6J5LHA2_9CAUD|nr:hypothetical protein UFOVP257_287 [uncultured Caudovirales phage]